MGKPRSGRDGPSSIGSLLRRGIRTLELPEPIPTECRNCGETFLARFALQDVCPGCVERNVRVTEEEVRQSRYEERRRRRLAMGLAGDLGDMRLGNFARIEQPAAFDAATSFVASWPAGTGNLAFLGRPGCGKTHLAVGIIHGLMEQGEDGRYVNWPALVADLAMATDWQAEASARIKPLYKAPLLVLDDIGREKSNPNSQWPLIVDRLINERHVGGYPTVICANLTTADLAGWLGEASASRFMSRAAVFEFRPGDRRFGRPRPALPAKDERSALVACSACAGAGWVIDAAIPVGRPERARKCPLCDGNGF